MPPGAIIATRLSFPTILLSSGSGIMTARHPLREQVPRTEAEAILGLRLAQTGITVRP